MAILGATLLTEPPQAVEADYRAQDRDWCHLNDFWSDEVQGLYSMTSAATTEEASRLIELSVASADFRGCDGGSFRVADFWTADVRSLYTTAPESDESE